MRTQEPGSQGLQTWRRTGPGMWSRAGGGWGAVSTDGAEGGGRRWVADPAGLPRRGATLCFGSSKPHRLYPAPNSNKWSKYSGTHPPLHRYVPPSDIVIAIKIGA